MLSYSNYGFCSPSQPIEEESVGSAVSITSGPRLILNRDRHQGSREHT